MNVLAQPFAASDPEAIRKRPIRLGERTARTGRDFSYRTHCPEAKLTVSVQCEGYAPYLSQTLARHQGVFCGPTIELGTVEVQVAASQ
jgi:hypothetical protein